MSRRPDTLQGCSAEDSPLRPGYTGIRWFALCVHNSHLSDRPTRHSPRSPAAAPVRHPDPSGALPRLCHCDLSRV